MKAERTKGMNEKSGMHINRPFYLVQRYPMKRVVECVGAHHMRLKTLHPTRANRGQ